MSSIEFFKERDKVDYILKGDNWKKSYKQLAIELNTSKKEIERIFWKYMDVFGNPKFYKIDVVFYPPVSELTRKESRKLKKTIRCR